MDPASMNIPPPGPDDVEIVGNSTGVPSDQSPFPSTLARSRRKRLQWWRTPLFVWPARLVATSISFISGAALCVNCGIVTGGVAVACGATAIGIVRVLSAMVMQSTHSDLFLITSGKRSRPAAGSSTGLAPENHDELCNGMAWNETLSAVWRIISSFHEGMTAPFTLRYLLLDAERIRRRHTQQYQLACSEPWPRSAQNVLIEGRHFTAFAMASYGFLLLKFLGILDETYDVFAQGSNPIDVVIHQLGLSLDDILLADLDGDHLGIPRHFVARDASTKSIVVSVRGTSSFSDVLLDLVCESAPFGGGYAHRGMKDAAYALYFAILPTVCTALDENKDYCLVIVGHSLGAGVAMLLTKILLDNGFPSVRCFAISPPPVFGPVHAIDESWSESLECFVLEDDIVPRLSLQTARALAMELESIGQMSSTGERVKSVHARRSASGNLLDGEMRSPGPERLISPLYIPTGRGIHWLLGNRDVDGQFVSHEERYKCVFAPASNFSHMLITWSCVVSHFPDRYVAAFDELSLPQVVSPRRFSGDNVGPTSLFHYYGELGS